MGNGGIMLLNTCQELVVRLFGMDSVFVSVCDDSLSRSGFGSLFLMGATILLCGFIIARARRRWWAS